jgi:hypothetical protein
MKSIFSIDRKLTENKNLCLELFYNKPSYFGWVKTSFKLFYDDYYIKLGLGIFGDYFFNFSMYWNRKMDHAGFTFELTLFGLTFNKKIYDCRHWDFINDDWKNTYVEN